MRAASPQGATRIDGVGGYVLQKIGSNWLLQHRLIMEKHLGHKLKPKEVVHHKDGERANNRLSNLEVMLSVDHIRLHAIGRRLSDEIRAKIGEANRKRIVSSETRAKMSKSAISRKHSAETRAKMSIAQKKRYAKNKLSKSRKTK